MFHHFFKHFLAEPNRAYNFIAISVPQIQNFRKFGPKLRLLQFCLVLLESPQILPMGCVWLIEFVFSLLQLQFWSDFSEILDLRFWSTKKKIEAAEHSWSANFGGFPAKQGRAGAASVLVWFFWNFGFKVLKHIQNCCFSMALFEKMVKHSNLPTSSCQNSFWMPPKCYTTCWMLNYTIIIKVISSSCKI